MRLKEYLVFVLAVIGGGIIGQWFVDVLNISKTDAISTLIAMVIPASVIYFLWKHFGEKAAR